ncbi:type II secretion system protein GspM [Bradyrhizobium brasilense]|uniref:Type II secretion system protein GspM n=1 Tax=Bradyrhizobium brasilense TaxID=1419277 RepID=A0ABY8JM34_9BRAD|nr:type II secretion system protein GspM [Bradyrhizobium brasilense]WFU66684.1 type II secretion system protein GspM [Bradyrhizobium brasilense]
MQLTKTTLNRLLFAAVNAAGVVLLYVVAVSPLASALSDQRARLDQLGLRQSHYEVLIDQQAHVESLLATLRAGRQAAAFLPGDSEAAASAQLQARLKQIAQQAGVHVQSVQGLDRRDVQDTRYLGAHLSIVGPIATIHAALDAIETGVPYLFVGSLTIRAPAIPAGVAPSQEADLDAQLDVYGATHVGPAP